MKPLFLIGFMGAGKTTLGRALAGSPHKPVSLETLTYIDLDDYIEAKAAISIREIFALHGEAAFRRMEADALREVAVSDNVIIGCGGGTPCQPGNMQWMNARGTTVLLRASHPVLLRRLIEAQHQRPLLNGMPPSALSAFISAKQAEREPFYSQARLTFPSDLLESEQQIDLSCRNFFESLKQHDLIP